MEADHDNIRDIVEPPYMEKNNDMLIHTGHDSNVDGYFVNQEMHNDSVHMEDHDNIRDVDAFHMDKDNDILTHIDHERDVVGSFVNQDDYYASVENGTQFPSCESFLQLLQGVGSNVIAPEDAPCMQSQMSQQPIKNQKQQSVEFVTRDNVRKSQRPRKVNMRLKRVIGDDHMENEESHIGASKAKRKFKDLHQLEAPKLKSKHFAQPIKAGGWSVVNQETIVMKFIGAKTIDHMYSQLKNVWNYVKNKIKKPNALGSDKDYHCMREGVVEWLLQEGKITIKIPMTPDSALLYLDLPSSVLLADAMQPLTDAAISFLVSQYRDITRYQEEVMNLPLAGIEALLSSDDLQVASEDNVYDFVFKWAKAHYLKLEERREVLGSRLVHLIRFPMMSTRRLKKVLASSELDHEVASKFVLEALFYKAEVPHRQRQLAMEDTMYRKYTERAYKYRPVKLVEFESPHQQCIVYLDLKKEECTALFPQGRVYSQAFHLGGQGFFLSAHCNMDQQSSFHCFGLFLGMQEKGSVSFSVDYEFGARQKPTQGFAVKYKGTYKFTGGKAVGYRNLFVLPWSSFVAEDSPYFIDNVLHLRAELIIKPE